MQADPKHRVTMIFFVTTTASAPRLTGDKSVQVIITSKEAAPLHCIWFARHYMVYHQTDFHTGNLTLYNPYLRNAGSGATG